MKKWIAAVAALAMAFGLAACTNGTPGNSAASTATSTANSILGPAVSGTSGTTSGAGSAVVSGAASLADKVSYKISTSLLPAIFGAGKTADEYLKSLQGIPGVTAAKLDNAGNVVVEMSKDAAAKLKETVSGAFDKLKASMVDGKTYPTIKTVTGNDAHTQYTVEVDKNAYTGSTDSNALQELANNAMAYQMANGVPQDQVKVTIVLKDKATGQILTTYEFPKTMQGSK